MVRRLDNPVGDDIIDEIRAGRAGIPHVFRLHRRGAMRQNPGPRAAGMAPEIHRDIDFPGPQLRRHLAVALRPGIVESIEGLHQPCAHVAAIVGTERNRGDLETPAVMALEHLCRQGGGDVLMEIGGKIRDANPVVPVPLALPYRGQVAGAGLAHIIP